MGQITVNGTTLYFEEVGHGKPLLFIHGMCGNADVWHDQIARLSEQFDCIAYDRRGHTRSVLGQISERTVQLHADDAAALIEELGAAPAILVASSGGARIGLDVVRRYPELVAGAVLSEPPAFALDPDGARTLMSELRPKIEAAMASGGPLAAVDAFFAYMCPGLWSRASEAQRDVYRDNQAELFGDLQMPAYQISTQDLARINRQCLIVSGSDSLPSLRNIARVISSNIPGAEHLELTGSGHVTYYERPTEFAAAVAGFAERVFGSGTQETTA